MQSTVITCESCGYPMRAPEDHGLSDPTNPRCRYCTNPDGSYKPYNEVFEATVSALMAQKHLKRRDAERTAHSLIDNLPAWRNQLT